MSRVFTNINVRTTDYGAVAAAVKRLPRRMAALVAPAVDGWVTVFDEASDAPDEDRLSGYTVMLSDKLQTGAIGFLVYESDVLIATVADRGRLEDHYSSWPDYFDENMDEREYNGLLGRERAWTRLSDGVSPADVRRVMDAEHDFAEEKLVEVVRLLRLPPNAARWGYNDIIEQVEAEDGAELPDGWDRFMRLDAAFQTL